MNGQWIYRRYTDGIVYKGEWKDDKMNGQGVYRCAAGIVYKGESKDNKMNG